VELAGVLAGAGFRGGRHFRQVVVVFRAGRATVIVMMRMLVWRSMLEGLQLMAAQSVSPMRMKARRVRARRVRARRARVASRALRAKRVWVVKAPRALRLLAAKVRRRRLMPERQKSQWKNRCSMRVRLQMPVHLLLRDRVFRSKPNVITLDAGQRQA
jgi:hypothetical protein